MGTSSAHLEPSAVPNPGSREAIAQGCICPRMDNLRRCMEAGDPAELRYRRALHHLQGAMLGE